jgi:predicted N-acetyltransferase YhbS
VATLMLHTRYRHQGIGRALMLAVGAEAGTPAAARLCSTLGKANRPGSFI